MTVWWHGERVAVSDHEQDEINCIQLKNGGSLMSAVLSPLVSEFETEAQEASYTAWLQAKAQASLSDTRPNIPHDQVMVKMRAMLDAK